MNETEPREAIFSKWHENPQLNCLMFSGAQYFTKTDEETLPESETTFGIDKFGKNSLSGNRLLSMFLGVRLSLQPGLSIKIFI